MVEEEARGQFKSKETGRGVLTERSLSMVTPYPATVGAVKFNAGKTEGEGRTSSKRPFAVVKYIQNMHKCLWYNKSLAS